NERGRFHDALWRIAKAFFSNPSGSMIVAGVTGTNGKTTTCWMLRDMFSALGEPSGYLGTLGIRYPGTERELENTTPFPIELNRLLAEIRDAHVRFLAMEVSSHALQERRSDGVEFDAGIFTNLTQDHLDYHGTMEAYEAAKRRFFEDLPSQSSKRFVAALNVDDPVGARLADGLACEKLTYGVRSGMLRGEAVSVSVDHLKVRLAWQGESLEASVGLGGHFNVMNCLSAVAGCLALGKSLAEAGAGLSAVRPVPGRFESVPNRHGIGVIVDYAHTPDALVKLLEAARAIDHQRLITVFGCGGDRDKGKRPKMARAVSERADLTVVTSDNPRTEDPQAILKDVSA
ncbi:MAG: UDP-N-acetylmuramoyl-L-alanyl-D-glutamate--2,6-diaminopimelate ligase, partial [Fimbriimonas ginsengisoli]|nr:UDP-N-acetylmuramoyl-L-alanyl-D-glutamate--2,6-diaminopimelate ligase [Fimbriimonas ginsengisoli]